VGAAPRDRAGIIVRPRKQGVVEGRGCQRRKARARPSASALNAGSGATLHEARPASRPGRVQCPLQRPDEPDGTDRKRAETERDALIARALAQPEGERKGHTHDGELAHFDTEIEAHESDQPLPSG
jgi:hypothetical protein